MRTLMGSINSIVQRAALCALVLFVAVPAHATSPNTLQLAAYEQASELERVRLLMSIAKSPDADQVTYLLKLHPLEGPYAANRTLFIEGMVLKSKGKYTEAAKNFRAALADDPKLTLVRAELAETLVILQQDDSAMHHLRLLAAEAPNEQAATGIRSFIDQVDARTPYKFTGYVSFAPSTNVNSGSKHTTVYSPALGINFATEQPKSGLGVAGGVSGAYSKRLGDDLMFVASGGVDARLYDDPIFNSYGMNQSLELRHLLQQGYVGIGLVSSQQLDNQNYEPSYISYGPRVSASLQVSPLDHLSISVFHEWSEPFIQGAKNSTTLMLDAAWTHAWDATLNATLFGGFDHVKTDLKVSSYQTVSAGLSVYKELTYGITVNIVGQVGKIDYAGFNALAGVTRSDKKVSGSLTLTKRDFNFQGFAPSATYSLSDTFSNINNYDSVSHAVDFRLTKDF
jgi:outer membrane protein